MLLSKPECNAILVTLNAHLDWSLACCFIDEYLFAKNCMLAEVSWTALIDQVIAKINALLKCSSQPLPQVLSLK